MTALIRLDKKCGKSGIPDNRKCSKTTSASLSTAASPSTKEIDTSKATNSKTKLLLSASGVAVAGIALGVLAHDVFTSGIPADQVPPKEAPEGLYDTFKPGDLIYNGIDFVGTWRAHYGIYLGKIDGKHCMFDVSPGKVNNSMASVAQVRGLEESRDAKNTSYAKAARRDGTSEAPSSEALMRIVKQLENKKFEWTGFEDNCEAFARALVNDTPVSTQGEQVTGFTRLISKKLLRLAAPKGFYESAFSLRYARQVSQAAMRVSSKNRTDGPSTAYYRTHPEAAAKKVRHQATINRRPEERKRRAALNRERRRRGIDGKGGPDVSHTTSGGTVLEAPSKNRARNGAGDNPRLKADSPWAWGFDAEPCWEGYQQVGMKRKGKKRVPNCVPTASKDDEDGKKYTKVVTNPETGRKNRVRYGAQGYRIAPGTDKGDRYCARSFGDMKSHGKDCSGPDRNTPLCLSRAKWKCSGKTSRR